MSLKVSIIIPVYNHASEAIACLENLTHQTYQSFEVIMVDDGSSDNIVQMMVGQTSPFPCEFVHFDTNQGAPVARNEGFKRSQGEYIIFLDADITLIPDALQKMVAALDEQSDCDFVYPMHYFGWKIFKSRPFDPELLRQYNYIHTSALLRRPSFPGFDESLKKFQDWDLWLTMTEHGSKGYWLPEVLFRIKTRKQGYSSWLPAFFYKIPWEKIGWMPSQMRKYRQAEDIIKRKHHLF